MAERVRDRSKDVERDKKRRAEDPEYRLKMQEAVSKHRATKLEKLYALAGGKCQCCGYNRCNSALEFHHVDPVQKSFPVCLRSMTKSWERVLNEAKKCVLVCANCHREIHEGVREAPEPWN